MASFRRIHLQDILDLKSQGLNQSQIAEKLNCSQAGVSRVCTINGIFWETGAAARDQRGEKNPNFINGMGRSTIERLTHRIVVMSGRNLHICERCQDESFPQEQHRHHKDRDRSNNTSENIEVLCSTCHRLEHEKDMVRNEKGQYV
jgi:hypothetical protein